MYVRSFRLEFTAKPSKIPNAGLGVFVTASAPACMTNPPECFKLEAGEMVDLGLYAPLRAEDQKKDCTNLIKNVIHKWKPETYSFHPPERTDGSQCDVFDITDDWTGELHQLARENILAYINETNGKSIPTILAEHDPAGCVHYLMGHHEKAYKSFKIPLDGPEIELFIDYGAKYEKVRRNQCRAYRPFSLVALTHHAYLPHLQVRVRKGYSRLRKKGELDSMKRSLAADDSDVVKEIKAYSADDVDKSIEFLECLYNNEKNVIRDEDLDKVARSLVLTILLLLRVQAILKEFEGVELDDDHSFCDNGYSSLEEKQTVERAKKLATKLCNVWHSSKALRNIMLSEEMYLMALVSVSAMKCEDPKALKALSADDFRKRIYSILRVD
jgi:hypothetical protein